MGSRVLPVPGRRPALRAFAGLVALCLAGLCAASATAWAQAPAAKPATAKVQKAATKPAWTELTAPQQAALAPLASTWAGISEAQKRKWLALSQNYPSLSPDERNTLHGRMTEWAALSPAQRNQARLNFAQTQGLTTEEKKAHWEAYQALSPEQKKELAAKAKASGAAPAVPPATQNKLAAVPTTRSAASAAPKTAAPASAARP